MSKKLRKPTVAMIAMLENVAAGCQTTAGLCGRSEHGGARWTEQALYKHGFLDKNGVTSDGYAAIANSRPGAESSDAQFMQSRMISSLDIDDIMERQYDWVDRMGWHNKTVLEALALVASEVGEAVDECRGKAPTHEFAIELADIILRVADLAKWRKVALATLVAKDRQMIGCQNKTVLEVLALIVPEIGGAVNECRGVEPTAKFGVRLANIIAIVAELADSQGIDIAAAIAAKMEVNERRGTRGRRI